MNDFATDFGHYHPFSDEAVFDLDWSRQQLTPPPEPYVQSALDSQLSQCQQSSQKQPTVCEHLGVSKLQAYRLD